MADELDAILARREKPRAKVGTADDLDAILAKHGGTSTSTGLPAQPAPTPKVEAPDTASATTLATTPGQAKAESLRAGKEDLRRGLLGDQGDAALYALSRGAVPGVDRFVGLGTDAGDAVASLVRGLQAPPPETAQDAREEYLRNEQSAAKDYPWTTGIAQAVGAIPSTIGLAGSGVPLARLSPAVEAPFAARLGIPAAAKALGTVAENPVAAARFAGQVANTPAGRLALGNAASGAMNSPSDDPSEQAKAGLASAAVGEVAGAAGEKVKGFLGQSVARRDRTLLQAVLKNSETDIAATATARKRFMERATAAIDEVKRDPILESAVNKGEAAGAASIARSTLQTISEPRAGLYKQLDSHGLIGIDHLDAQIRIAERTATGAEKKALEAWRAELNNDWIPKWKEEGRLGTVRLGKQTTGADRGGVAGGTGGVGVTGLGVREWVSKAQKASALVIGGLEEGPRKEVKAKLEDIAEDIWRKHLATVAKADPQLVKNIRAYDKRASGLIALDEVMEQRARKDQEGVLGFVKKHGGQLDALAVAGAGAGALVNPQAALTGFAAYQAAKRIPKTASAFNDALLVPLQKAAEAGKTWAEFANQAATVGLPQGMARVIFDRAQAKRGASNRTTSTETR